MDVRVVFGVLFFLALIGCLLGWVFTRKTEPTEAPFETQLATLKPVSADEARLEAARLEAAKKAEAEKKAEEARLEAAKKAEEARNAGAAASAAAALAEAANKAAAAAQPGSETALTAKAATLTAEAESAAARAAQLNSELRAAAAEAAAAEAARLASETRAAEAEAAAAEASALRADEGRRRDSAPDPAPVVSETTLPSWPFEVGASGASCAATCGGKGLVCDEEKQASATYGRAIAFEALRRGGVAQKGESEDEWQGSFRVRDKYPASGDQAGSMPGLWMQGSGAAPNWKSEDHKSVQSTCTAAFTGLRRVCACKEASTQPPATNPPATNPPATNPPATNPPATNPPATNPPATNPPATAVPEREAWALSAGERAAGLETRLVYERGKGLSPGVPETPVDFPDPGMRRYLFPENQKQHIDFGTYVLVIELVEGALERLGGGNIVLFKLSEFKNTGDPEIHISRARGLRVYEGGASKELNAPEYYAGTKLVFINDRKRGDSEMLVRAGDKTITVKMNVSWPGCNTPMELQVHDLVKRAVFLWGRDTVTLDVSALKAEV